MIIDSHKKHRFGSSSESSTQLALELILEELEKPDSQYDYCVCQATDNAVPFYESLGFVRVGAIARYETTPKACGDGH